MIKYNNNTIYDWNFDTSNLIKVYRNNAIVFYKFSGEEPPTPPTPSGNCYEVIQTPIDSYTSTTYDSVYSFDNRKWYMKNNLNQYEEYGIYETGTSLSDFTYYPNKLAVIGETEYQYQTNGWVEVGEYIEVQTTYEVTNDPTALEGNTLPTTFKIPYDDIEDIGRLDFSIYIEDGSNLYITTDSYEYEGEEFYEGTVTNDEEYYYFSLPSEAPSSIVIQEINYFNPSPIHLIFGNRQASVEYAEKEMPLNQVYSTVAEMEATTCPNVGINEYGVVGNDVYQFEETEEWINKAKSSLKFVAKYNDNKVNVIECNTSNELSSGDTQPSYLSKDVMTEAYIGDCVTSIGGSAFYYCRSLTSVTIPNSVIRIGSNAFYNTPWWSSYSADTSHHYGNIIYINDVACQATSTTITSCEFKNGTVSIGYRAFANCRGLTSVTIPNSVTSIGGSAFENCRGLTSVTIPSGVTSISEFAFNQCSGLTSVTIPSGVTSIDRQAFSFCTSLTSVTIPSGVTNIGLSAFWRCSGLTSITINAATPPTLDYRAFDDTNNCPIYVPSSSVDTYKSASGWSVYASRIQAIPT